MRAILALLTVAFSSRAFAASPELTIELKDFAAMPITGAVDGPGNAAGLLARINFLREEPGVRKNRVFVNDLNGPLYILDKETKQVSTYLNFNGLDGKPGIFHRLAIDNLLASGFISFRIRPRLRAQRQVLYDPSREPGAGRFQSYRTTRTSRVSRRKDIPLRRQSAPSARRSGRRF